MSSCGTTSCPDYLSTKSKTQNKLSKFSLGESGKKTSAELHAEKEDMTPEEKKAAETKKIEDGRMMENEDDAKEELDMKTVWAAMDLLGGRLTWLVIIASFVFQEAYGKYLDYVN